MNLRILSLLINSSSISHQHRGHFLSCSNEKRQSPRKKDESRGNSAARLLKTPHPRPRPPIPHPAPPRCPAQTPPPPGKNLWALNINMQIKQYSMITF